MKHARNGRANQHVHTVDVPFTRFASRVFILALAACFLMPSTPALAANEALVKLLGILRDRGSITPQEYADLVLVADPGAAPASPSAQPAPAVPTLLTARVQALEKANQSGEVAKKALAGSGTKRSASAAIRSSAAARSRRARATFWRFRPIGP